MSEGELNNRCVELLASPVAGGPIRRFSVRGASVKGRLSDVEASRAYRGVFLRYVSPGHPLLKRERAEVSGSSALARP